MRPPVPKERPIGAEDIALLKELARLGGLRDYVYTSSRELANRVSVSQQTSSRRILDLLERGYITRRMSTRKQWIRLSGLGVDVLRREFHAYRSIFEEGADLKIRGRVVKGLGEGQYYISRDGYKRAFKELLGFEPYPGTLNVEVEPLDREKMLELKELTGILIKEFVSEGRTFGAVKCFPAGIGDVKVAAILPVRSHHTNVLELISPHHLRAQLELEDGDEITVLVKLD